MILAQFVVTLLSALPAAETPVSLETAMVRMRDGVLLATDVYGSEASNPKPVLLARTPYDKKGMRKRAEEYAREGYVVVIQDCRGRYASQGAYTPYNNDKQDGYDTLEWIQAQRWSNGKAGMFGGSHLGLVQWLAAAEQAPGLVAITPAFTASSQYRVAYRDGVLRMALISSAGTRASPPPPPQKLPTDIGRLMHFLPILHLPLSDFEKAYGWDLPWMTSILRHPRMDGFWTQTSAEADIPKMDLPVQLVSGYYDFFHHETMRDFELLQARQTKAPVQLILGPWTHGGGASQIVEEEDFGPGVKFDLAQANLLWFDTFLRGKARKFPLIRYFSMGDNHWFEAGQWPPKEARVRRIAVPPATFESDPANPVPSIPKGRKDIQRQSLWSPVDLSSIAEHRGVYVHEEAPLHEPLRIAGPVSAQLTVESNPPHADWIVRLFAVRKNGRWLPLAQGVKRGNFARGSQVVVDMGSVAALLEAGTKLRIEIAGSSFPLYDRNLHTGAGPTDARHRIAVQRVIQGAVLVNQVLP